ncbi:hypothetical protein CTA2_12360 [Colletotrichum tanaceti]|nr:hypothetical protein CTA2_12360 [Colletotrichum tanaceti]
MEADLQLFNSLISGDRRSNHELTNLQRVAIVAFVLAGKSYRETASAFNCSVGVVSRTLQRYRKDHTFESLPRKGRPENPLKRKKRAMVPDATISEKGKGQ